MRTQTSYEAGLWTMTDIATHFGVLPPTVRGWRHLGIIPPPDIMVGPSPVWLRETVLEFKLERQSA